MDIAILLFNDVEELDFVGPWEVFTMIRTVLPGLMPDRPMPNPYFVSAEGGMIACAKGMRVMADHSFADAPQPDIILVPGGIGTRPLVNDATVLGWIRAAAATARWVTSVCTGSLLLTAAGPAKGKTVTTHWAFVKTLRERGEAGEVLDNRRWVQDGHVVTAAGVSAGIDMALWLTGQVYSPEVARATQRAMEYDPAPPYQTAG